MSRSLFKTGGSTISSFSTVVGITLVLTMVGILFIFLLVANAVTEHFKEQLTVQLFLKEGATEEEILIFKKEIEGKSFAGDVSYTSAQQAAQVMQQELGEEFVDFLGYNPLPASIDIKVNPSFSALDSLETMIADIDQNSMVNETVYQKGLLQQVNENIGKWGLGLLVVGILFLIIAVVLIVNTIELAIFSQRFIIKSMQLVGATHWFIQKPFLKRGLWFGFISSILALTLLSAILFYLREPLRDVVEILIQGYRFFILLGGIVITGLAVSWLATAYAVRRFVRLSQSDLY
jgi:cell division transport system permease protein